MRNKLKNKKYKISKTYIVLGLIFLSVICVFSYNLIATRIVKGSHDVKISEVFDKLPDDTLLKSYSEYKDFIRKYLSDSLEEKYATSINRLIDSFDFYEDQKKLEEEYSILINNLKIKFKEYANEIFASHKIMAHIDLNFDCNFDTFVDQVHEIIKVYVRNRRLVFKTEKRIQELTEGKEKNLVIINFIDEIKRKLIEIDSSIDFNKNIDEIRRMLKELSTMMNKHQVYCETVLKLENIIGDCAPDSLIIFLNNINLALWEGRYAYLDSLVFGMNLSLEKFQSRKSDVFSSLALIKENYNTRINSLGKNDLSKIDVANKMLEMIKEILKIVLKGQESRDILRTLTSIKFENIEEIYDIVQSKTKNVFVKINEKYDGETILLKTGYANSKLYCTGFTSFGEETFEFHRSTFIRNYISLYDLLTSGKIDKKYLLEFASIIGMPLNEDLQNSSEISIINKAVDYLDAKRTINKSNKNVVLKREKI